MRWMVLENALIHLYFTAVARLCLTEGQRKNSYKENTVNYLCQQRYCSMFAAVKPREQPHDQKVTKMITDVKNRINTSTSRKTDA